MPDDAQRDKPSRVSVWARRSQISVVGHHKGLDLVESHRKLDGIPRLPVGDERSRVAHENAEQLKWFADQYNVLPERFGKYLNLTRLE
jgi:hypothetical protein